MPTITRNIILPHLFPQHSFGQICLHHIYLVFDGCFYKTSPASNDGLYTIPTYSIGIQAVRYAHVKSINMLYADYHVESLPAPLYGRGTQIGANSTLAKDWSNGKCWYAK